MKSTLQHNYHDNELSMDDLNRNQQNKLSALLQTLTEDNNGTDITLNLEIGDVKSTITDLMDNFKLNIEAKEKEFTALLDKLTKGTLAPADLQKLLNIEKKRSLYSFQAVDSLKDSLNNVFKDFNKLLMLIKENSMISKTSVDSLYFNLDVCMQSVMSVSRVATSAPNVLEKTIDTAELEMEKLSEDKSYQGYFGSRSPDILEFSKYGGNEYYINSITTSSIHDNFRKENYLQNDNKKRASVNTLSSLPATPLLKNLSLKQEELFDKGGYNNNHVKLIKTSLEESKLSKPNIACNNDEALDSAYPNLNRISSNHIISIHIVNKDETNQELDKNIQYEFYLDSKSSEQKQKLASVGNVSKKKPNKNRLLKEKVVTHLMNQGNSSSNLIKMKGVMMYNNVDNINTDNGNVKEIQLFTVPDNEKVTVDMISLKSFEPRMELEVTTQTNIKPKVTLYLQSY